MVVETFSPRNEIGVAPGLSVSIDVEFLTRPRNSPPLGLWFGGLGFGVSGVGLRGWGFGVWV